MTEFEQYIIDKIVEMTDKINDKIADMKNDMSKDIKELSEEVHKNNGVKDLIEKNAEAIENNTNTIGGNAKLISEHLISCSASEKRKSIRKTDFKWIAGYIITVGGLLIAIFLR